MFRLKLMLLAILAFTSCILTACQFRPTTLSATPTPSIFKLDEKHLEIIRSSFSEYPAKKALVLFSQGVAVDAQDPRGNTLLYYAAEKGQHELVQSLLDLGADPNLANKEGNTPLHLAANLDTTRNLLKFKAKLVTHNQAGETPFHTAVQRGKFDQIKFMLLQKAELMPSLARGEKPALSPLFMTSMPGIIRLLIEAGSDLSARDLYGDSILHKNNDQVIIEDLLKRGMNVDTRNQLGLTPLQSTKSLDKFRILLKLGADPNASDPEGLPLFFRKIGGADILNELIKNKADINQTLSQHTTFKGYTPMHYAIAHSDLGMVEFLVKAGADLNLQTPNGNSPLHFAFRAYTPGNFFAESKIHILLDAKPKPDLSNHIGETPLLLAARIANPQITEKLLKLGANPNHIDQAGNSVLSKFLTGPQFNEEHLILLLKYGADPNPRAGQKSSPLQTAVGTGSVRLVTLLLENNRFVKSASVLEEAIQRAERRKDIELAEFLKSELAKFETKAN